MTYLLLTNKSLQQIPVVGHNWKGNCKNPFFDHGETEWLTVAFDAKFEHSSIDPISYEEKVVVRLLNTEEFVTGVLEIYFSVFGENSFGKSVVKKSKTEVPFALDTENDEASVTFARKDVKIGVGLPPMDDEDFDSVTSHLNAVLLSINYIANNSVYFEKIDRAERRRIQRDMNLPKGDDYYELSLNQKKYPKGYTHPSDHKVRYHFVRGHYRQYENHRTWIKPHWKGDKTLGVVHKDYAA